MKKLYYDAVQNTGCIGFFAKEKQIAAAGTTVYVMPQKYFNDKYLKYANEYDVHFIFDNNIPKPDFYTIPYIDIMAQDSKGGYIATLDSQSDIESDAPIIYIDSYKKCYMAADNARNFLENIASWREKLFAFDEIKFYKSKDEAAVENEFIKLPLFEKKLNKITE